ncbi:MAG: hypothetical protein JWN37_371 [Candidatus Nomurabacteria bacterium]|nr:hypothetical protein [Candidatus Nomurabacteria bacterium]
MRFIFGIIGIALLLFVWMSVSGYKDLGFSKSLGTEYFNTNGSSTKNAADSILPNVKGEAATVEITHIKTPVNVKAIYMSSWVASDKTFRAKLVKIINTTEVNAVVIDVKDNTGLVSWDGRVSDLDDFVKELHSKNIYVIGRVAAFQDPAYVKAHPDEAVHSKSTGGVWKDNKGVPWVDTGDKLMWDYLLDISKQAYARGFDEINLDYIRFPTDGKLSDMTFPISGDRGLNDKAGVVGDFYRYITDALHKEKIPVSADIFGIVMLTTVDIKTLGQDMHVALQTFDYVSPMVYPSHFYEGTDGFKNPADHPGEIITYSMSAGVKIAQEVASSTGQDPSIYIAKYRPFYQDFDLGATYTAEMVRAQIDAGYKLGINSWMLWDPANSYTLGALKSQ